MILPFIILWVFIKVAPPWTDLDPDEEVGVIGD
jgi:hypothetical protein